MRVILSIISKPKTLQCSQKNKSQSQSWSKSRVVVTHWSYAVVKTTDPGMGKLSTAQTGAIGGHPEALLGTLQCWWSVSITLGRKWTSSFDMSLKSYINCMACLAVMYHDLQVDLPPAPTKSCRTSCGWCQWSSRGETSRLGWLTKVPFPPPSKHRLFSCVSELTHFLCEVVPFSLGVMGSKIQFPQIRALTLLGEEKTKALQHAGTSAHSSSFSSPKNLTVLI